MRCLRTAIPLVLLWASGCNQARLIGDDGLDMQADAGAPDLAPTIYDDLPAAPILDPAMGALPADIADQFGPVDSGAQAGGPCVLEPEAGSLFPANWLRLRVRLLPAAGQNVFEIRLSAANQRQVLRVYTSNPTYTVPAAIWQGLSAHTQDQPLHLTVRGARLVGGKLSGAPALGLSADVTIAPVPAPGTIVYWTTSSGTALKGFTVGDEKVQEVYRPAGVGTQCIGCHTSSPDGAFIGFSASATPTTGEPATIDLRSADARGQRPAFLSAAAAALLGRQYQQLPSFSRAHYSAGDRVMVSVLLSGARYEIIWTDLEAKAGDPGVGWGVLRRDGDAGSAAAASFSHDGQRVVYVSASAVGSGVTSTDGDVRVIPYASRAGGASTPLQGASDPAWNEFYPAFAPDDQLVAFTRVKATQSSYNNPEAEVYVVPAAGGAATRLAANTPPACGGAKSPGVTNSWPKWSPEVGVVGGRRYYWLTFSSTRNNGVPQLFLAPVIVEGGALRSAPALYLWNQNPTESNHTPAWDVFKLIVG